MAGLIGAIDEPIRVFAPGLYHTQSKAISSLMVDYSSNFENLVQSPELLGLLAPLYASVEEPWFKKITSGAPSKYWLYWSHVVRLARFLNGAILLYNFALAPNIRAIRKLAEPMFTPRAGEGTFTIEGLRTFSTEDPSLQHAVLQGIPELTGLTSADIIYHKIVFRSTAYTALTWTMLAKAIAAHNPLVRIHGYPSAEQIFATAQYSFVVDWALNLSSLINDHEVYANSPSLPLRIGHTVHVELAASDGRWFENFFRSTEAKYPMDPPGITWLPTTNLPAIAIPFGIQQLFR